MIVAADDKERAEGEGAISSLLNGFQVDAVEYLIPASMVGTKLTKGEGFEHAEAGVSLMSQSGERRTIRWSQYGVAEGLWIGEGLPQEGHSWVRDVSLVPASSWAPLLGSRVEISAVGWQEIAPDVHSIWTIRLDLRAGSVVIALGESHSESRTLSYIPDCVVALFDSETGENYRPPASSASAW